MPRNVDEMAGKTCIKLPTANSVFYEKSTLSIATNSTITGALHSTYKFECSTF